MLAFTLAVMLSFQMKMPADHQPVEQNVLRFQTSAALKHQFDDGSGAGFYICPKDETLLRVKSPVPGTEYKCPVDGTVMHAGKGPQSKYFLLDEKRYGNLCTSARVIPNREDGEESPA
jgi:hypothetical protein